MLPILKGVVSSEPRLVSKYLFPLKGSPGLLREEADYRTGAGNVQDEPGTTCVPIK